MTTLVYIDQKSCKTRKRSIDQHENEGNIYRYPKWPSSRVVNQKEMRWLRRKRKTLKHAIYVHGMTSLVIWLEDSSSCRNSYVHHTLCVITNRQNDRPHYILWKKLKQCGPIVSCSLNIERAFCRCFPGHLNSGWISGHLRVVYREYWNLDSSGGARILR